MKHEPIKSVRLLQIDLLKQKLVKSDFEYMMDELLVHITNFRTGKPYDEESAHNLKLILVDVDQYKNFEKRLKKESMIFFQQKASRFFKDSKE